MPTEKFTVTGATERGHPIFIHASALDLIDLHQRIREVFPLGVDYVVFSGHLEFLESSVPLQALEGSPARLIDKG